MSLADSTLWVVADALRDAVVSYAAAEGWSIPARQLVTVGAPAIDCEMVAVSVVQVTPPEPEGHKAAANWAWLSASFDLWVARCWPLGDEQGRPPAVAAEEAATAATFTDVLALWSAVRAAVRAGDVPSCSGVVLEGGRTYGPEGGFTAAVVTVRVPLAGA